jgi:DNA helicase-2/ATP-dependent DNA helicase PcrA
MAVRDLTDEQLSALWHVDGTPIVEGRTKILARPGTGKTFTVTTYCIDSVSMWENSHSLWHGMAVLSYTNVAKNEIRKRIADEQQGAELLSFPHYIGTIDSFINQFIFLPFGSRVMNCKKRPTLIGEPHTPGKSINKTSRNKFGGIMAFDHFYYFYRTSYDLNGGLYLIGSDKQTNANGSVDLTDTESKIKIKSWVKVDGSYGAYSEKIHNYKQQQKLSGYATQADANFYSLKLLREHEDIRMLVSSRFKSIIIDEAQDMTEIQHAIFDLLCNAEDPLENCVLIGDDAQAIYEWNTARPDLFTNKPQFTKKVLTNTFRCSQAVCDVLNILEPLSPISPEGKNKGYLDKIKQIDWQEMSEDVIRDTIQQFVECVSIKEPHDQKNEYLSVAVLARSRDLGSIIRSIYVGRKLTTIASSAKFSNETTKPNKVIFFIYLYS